MDGGGEDSLAVPWPPRSFSGAPPVPAGGPALGPPCGTLFPDRRWAGGAAHPGPGSCQPPGALRSCSRRSSWWPRTRPTLPQLVATTPGTVQSRVCCCFVLRGLDAGAGWDVAVPIPVPELGTTRPGRDIAGQSAAGAELPGLAFTWGAACRVVAELLPGFNVCVLLSSLSLPDTCHLCP